MFFFRSTRGRFFVVLLLLAAWVSCSRFPNPLEPPEMPASFQKGMTLACWSSNCYSGDLAQQSLQDLMHLGAEWVGVVVTGYQGSANSTEIRFNAENSPRDASVATMIHRAHEVGAKVMLKPHVDVQDGTWRGMIEPADRDAWFANYNEFILHYAEIAESHQVEQFVIGTELASFNRDTRRWFDLIAKVRAVYSGKLLYAASWNEYERVDFWEALDYAGINAYFSLTSLKDPSVLDLLAGWEFWLMRLDRWQRQIGKEVIFTEIGYTSRDGTNMHPFEFDNSAPMDMQEQADCYAAALQAFAKIPYLKGAFWWHWPTDMAKGHLSIDYSPRDKPAEAVLRAAWSPAQ